MHSLDDEIRAEELREKALVLKSYLSRDDLNVLTKEFGEYIQEKGIYNEPAEPWYVWLMSKVKVRVTI